MNTQQNTQRDYPHTPSGGRRSWPGVQIYKGKYAIFHPKQKEVSHQTHYRTANRSVDLYFYPLTHPGVLEDAAVVIEH